MFEPQNSPFITKEQIEIENRNRPTRLPPQTQQQQPQLQPQQQLQQPRGQTNLKPLVDLQVYQPTQPPKKPFPTQINPALYSPIPVQTPYYPPQYNPTWPYYFNSPLTGVTPIIKQYSINNGPFVNYSSLDVIKEDSLPKQLLNTSNTIAERIDISSFVRSVFIKHNDGEDINLDGKGNNSLLSYLKFMELNPYSKTQHPENPYKGLPDYMVIYRSCYPVRYDERSSSVQCAPNSLGMNIRIYRLSNGEYNVKKMEPSLIHQYNVWRELAYYEYVREHIIKRNVSPNFVIMYGYYIAERCNIDFDKIRLLKGQNYTKPLPLSSNAPSIDAFFNSKKMAIQINPTDMQYELDKYSGRGVVALTEGPTNNFSGWTTKTYRVNGNIQKMVNRGFYRKEVWMSVLFQLSVALYVMQLHGIAFNEFTLQDNVYIKEVSEHENLLTYWKYKINGFEFYVPNYGYLVQIDSNFKNLSDDTATLLGVNVVNDKRKKLYANMFNDGIFDSNTIYNMGFMAFTSIFSENNFSNSFSNQGGIKPPEEILNLLQRINSAASQSGASNDISWYIVRFMASLLNNRVGTFLTKLEFEKIRKDDASEFKEGQIVVHEVGYDTYKFVVFLGYDNNSKVSVLTRDNPNSLLLEDVAIEKSLLYNYSKYENILQNYKPGESSLNDDDLLETYIVMK